MRMSEAPTLTTSTAVPTSTPCAIWPRVNIFLLHAN